jgi:hypothetical protein
VRYNQKVSGTHGAQRGRGEALSQKSKKRIGKICFGGVVANAPPQEANLSGLRREIHERGYPQPAMRGMRLAP